MLQVFTESGYMPRMYCSISRMARPCSVNSPSFCRGNGAGGLPGPWWSCPLNPRPAHGSSRAHTPCPGARSALAEQGHRTHPRTRASGPRQWPEPAASCPSRPAPCSVH